VPLSRPPRRARVKRVATTYYYRQEKPTKPRYLPWYAIALALVIVGAFAFGVPVSTVLLLIVLACPVMMMFMMGGGHGDGSGHDSNETPQHRDSAGRS
jgi:hypothetical protein